MSLIPEKWQECHAQLMCLRWGNVTEIGRKMDCSPDNLTAWYIETGHVDVKTPRASFRATPGTWLFLGSGYRSQRFSADARLFSVVFRVSWKGSLRPVLDLRPGFTLPENAILRESIGAIRERYENVPEFEWNFRIRTCDFVSFLGVESWFFSWLGKAIPIWKAHLPNLETASEVDTRVERALDWIMAQKEMLPIVDFKWAALAAGLSLGHLNRLFGEYYHQSLCGFHEQRRLQYARRRLLEPGARIKEVAHEMGFVDLSKFSNWFKRFERVSPRDYKRGTLTF